MRLRSRVRRALFPVAEWSFTYRRYDRFLARLTRSGATVVPLRDFAAYEAAEQAVVALRHDVDFRLGAALELARLEHARGLRATYFVLHTARYWSDDRLLPALRRIQDEYGHEIGWHNDLVTVQCVYGVDARAYLQHELKRLRTAGIAVVGVASHGSTLCYRYGYHNNYFFSDFNGEVVKGFPNTDAVQTARGRTAIERSAMEDFGFEYEAYHLDNDLYFSDTATSNGRRWHPDALESAALARGHKTIILLHPCHWDRSVTAKISRLGRLMVDGSRRREADE
jgi:hypothetical protein